MKSRESSQRVDNLLQQIPMIEWLATVGYVLIFLFGFEKIGPSVAALSVIPVMVAGWKYGMWTGLIVGLLFLPLNTALFYIAGLRGLDVVFRAGGGPGTVVLILLGAASGWVHDLNNRLRREVARNRTIEAVKRKGEEEYRSMFDGLPIGIFRTTPEGKILDANPALAQILGFSEMKDLLQVNVKELYTTIDERAQTLNEIEEHGVVKGLVFQLRRVDGSLVWVEENVRAIRDFKGRILFYEGSLIDITERKRIEDELRKSEAKYRDLFSNIPQKVFYKNRECIYLAVNPAYARDLDILPEELSGKSDFDIYPADLAGKYREDDIRVMEAGVADEFDEDYVQLGDRRTVHTIKVPVLNEAGLVTGLIGIFWDITDRKRMEEAIQESQHRYFDLFEHSPISLWEEDFSPVKNFIDLLREQGVVDFIGYFENHPDAVKACQASITVMDVNQATLGLYCAHSKEELLGKLDRVLVEQANPLFMQVLRVIADGQSEFEGETINKTLTGKIINIYMRASAAPGYETSLAKVLVSIQDITARKQAEELLHNKTIQTEALAEISGAFSTANLDTEKVYHIIVERVANLIGDDCILTLLSEDELSHEVAAYYSRNLISIPRMRQSLPAGQSRIGSGVVGRAIRKRQAILIPEITAEKIDEWIDPGFEEYFRQFNHTSVLAAPLIANGQVIGTLSVATGAPGRMYTADDQALLQNLANQAALTLMNVRLHDIVKHQARTDPLTGLYNRRYFFDLAELEFAKAKRKFQPVSMIMLDLDHFKQVNDTHGHPVGDDLLLFVTELCRNTIREADLLGRMGGDEFAILLPETNLPDATVCAERVCKTIAATLAHTAGGDLSITVSMGVAANDEFIPDLTALFKAADEALYIAKRKGRNQVAKFNQ